ncbi:hypothetical protein FS749_015996 [Ceratobasidium sp. UAMH 11750]|nr:hypothetical protein FS749_015996 [Ceratobasidium sp. UAMH 11750]
MTRDTSHPPSSSPAPIRESQPWSDSPTETAHGTKPYHALYDTPPEGTQPPKLKRSDRARTKSWRIRETFKYEQQSTPAISKSNATASQPPAATATQTTGSQRRKGSAKRRTLRFDGESSGDEPGNKSGAESPPPKPPGRGRVSAPGDHAPEQRVILKAETAHEFGNLIGIDVSTAMSTTIKEALRTLSDTNPPQVGPARRYSQVRGEASAPLPSLNKKGGYYRETLLKLAYPPPSESQKRARSDEEDRPAKHTCGEIYGEDHGESADEEMWDPDADKPEPSAPAPPHLPSFFLRPQPLSTSSTQRAMVNAFASQRSMAKTPDFRPTPVPQPKHLLSWSICKPRTSNSKSRAPNSESHTPNSKSRAPNSKPRPTSPDLIRPSPGSHLSTPEPCPSSPLSHVLTPEPHLAKVARVSRPATSNEKPVLDPNSATEEETESEPQLKPKPKRRRQRSKKKGQGKHESPKPGTEPSDRRQNPAGECNTRDAPPGRHRDTSTVLQRLNKLLNNDPDADPDEVESLLQQAIDLTQQRHTHHHPSLHTWPGPSSRAEPGPSSRAQPGASSSRARPVSSSSCTRPVSSSSRTRSGPLSGHHGHQWATREGHPPGHSSEEGVSAGEETDVEDTDADDPIVLEKSGLGRYPGTRGKVASRAIPKLLATAIRKGIYQHQDTNLKWARNAYRRVWKAFCPHIRYRECPLDLLQTIICRISNLRTEIKKRIRQLIRYLFGFMPGLSEKVLLANQRLVARLGHNNFHCGNLVPNKNQSEHEAFISAIYDAYFWCTDSCLVRDTEHMDEMVENGLPLPAVAFVLTMMQDCIEEWQTGQFKPRDLNLTIQRSVFDAHLMGLIVYRRKAPKRLSDFQKAWFEHGMRVPWVCHFADD